MEAALAQSERAWLSALASQEERADLVSHTTLLHDDPGYVNTYLDRLGQLTHEQVGTRRGRGCARTTGRSSPTCARRRRRRMSAPRPPIAPAKPWAFPTPTTTTLPNGIRLLTFDIPGQYVISVRLAIPLSLTSEPRTKEGIASVMARLLDEGTAQHGPEEFAELLERKGVALGAGMAESALVAELDVPKRHLADALDLLRQMLEEPSFPEAEVRRAIATRRAEIEQERASAPHRAAREFVATYYDPAERASRPSGGSLDTVGSITRDDIVAMHERYVGPVGATLVVSGDLGDVDVAGVVRGALASWSVPHQEAPAVAVAARRASDAARIVVVDRPGSVQSEFSSAAPARTGTWRGGGRHTRCCRSSSAGHPPPASTPCCARTRATPTGCARRSGHGASAGRSSRAVGALRGDGRGARACSWRS